MDVGTIPTKGLNMISTTDKAIIKIINPNLATGPWIAGGAVMTWFEGGTLRSTNFPTAQDIDVFFADPDQFEFTKQQLVKNNSVRHLPFVSDNAETYQFELPDSITNACWKVQLIKKNYFKSTAEILHNFDFTCCGFATDGNKYTMLPNAAKDLNNKVLHINRYNSETILSRTIKYWIAGFEPGADVREALASADIQTNFSGHTDYDHAF